MTKPFISICTPTFNRRPFIPMIIKCFENQTYPLDRMEWIIIDDGTDKIEDLVKDIKQVKYFHYPEKMFLGKKRNEMHDKCSGDIIIYMDDDDYYPPTRVAHAVDTLLAHPEAMCAGCSQMFIYFKHIDKMFQFGPYGPNHATAASFAFRKELLLTSRYEETAALAEESAFLKQYTVPFVQLDVFQTILVFSHVHNSFDKRKMLEVANNYVQMSEVKVTDFVKDSFIWKFFMVSIDKILEKYEQGLPKYKPDVLKQMEELTIKRTIKMYEAKIAELTRENTELKDKNLYLNNKIKDVISNAIMQHKQNKDSKDNNNKE